MNIFPIRWFALFAPLFLAALLQHAQEKADPPKAAAAVDQFDDPLPAGVRARLGTARWRQGSQLFAAAFSADGKTLATAGNDNLIRLWTVATGREFAVCEGHKLAVTALLFLPGDKKLVSGSADGTLRLWDAGAGRQLACSDAPPQGVCGVLALTPDGKTLLSTSSDQRVRSWDADTLKLATTSQPPPAGSQALALSPDGRWFANYNVTDRNIHLYDAATGKEDKKIPLWVNAVYAMTFSPDGKTLALCGTNPAGTENFFVFDVATGNQTLRSRIIVGGFVSFIGPLAFSPNGKFIAGAAGKSVTIWGVTSGKELRQFDLSATARVLAFAPGGDLLAVGGTDQTVRLFDVPGNKELSIGSGHHGPILSVRFAADGRTIVTTGQDRTARVWDAKNGKELQRLSWPLLSSTSLTFAEDGRTALSNNIAHVTLYDLKENGFAQGRLLNGVVGPLTAAALSSDLASAAACRADGTLIVSDVATNKVRFTVPGGPASISRGTQTLAFSPDSKVLVATGNGQTVRMLDAFTGAARGEFGRLTGGAKFAFSPDGRTMITFDPEVRVWEFPAGQERLKLEKPPPAVLSAAVSPDGWLLALGLADGTIQLREPAKGEVVAQLKGQRGGIQALAFSTDGQALASGSMDSTVLVWDVAEYQKKARPAVVERKKEELERLLNDLASADAVQAHQAVRLLASSAGPTAANLAERVRQQAPDAKRVKQLIADLDDDAFKVREKASANLFALGEAATEAIQKALANHPSAEANRRLLDLLERRRVAGPNPQAWQPLRGLEALELLGSPEAKQELEKLAKDFADVPLGQQAKAAVERLARRLQSQP